MPHPDDLSVGLLGAAVAQQGGAGSTGGSAGSAGSIYSGFDGGSGIAAAEGAPVPATKAGTPPRGLLVACYSVFASMYMLVSLVAPFFPVAAAKWGLSQQAIGLVISCDPIGEVLSAVVATYIMARVGMAQSATLGMAGNALSSCVFGLAPLVSHTPSFLLPIFVLMRLVNGVATNVTFVSLFTLLCCLQPGKSGQVTGNTAVLTSVGLILGPPFGGVLHQAGGAVVGALGLQPDWQFAAPFIGCSVVMVLPSLWLWAAREQAAAAEEDDEEEEELRLVDEMQRMYRVLDGAMAGGIGAVLASMVMSNAMYTILGPHLAPRCEAPPLADVAAAPGEFEALRRLRLAEHQPYGYSPLAISAVFSAGTLAFLPLSVWGKNTLVILSRFACCPSC